MTRSFATMLSRLCLVTLAIATLPIVANARVVLYNYANPFVQDVVLNPPRPTNNADIGTLAALPGSYIINSITYARINGTTNGEFDVSVFIWGNVNPNAPAGTSMFSNLLAYSAPITRTVTNANQGAAFASTANFNSPLFVMQGGATFGYQVVFAEKGTINVATAAYTPTTLGIGTVYSASGGTGFSANNFYGNNDATGKVQASDINSFSAPNEAKSTVYLGIVGTLVIPEPGTMGLCLLGGIGIGGIVRRRYSRPA